MEPSRELTTEIGEHSTLVTFEKSAIVFCAGPRRNLVFWLHKGFVKLSCLTLTAAEG